MDFIAFDQITPPSPTDYWDHAIGDNSTGNGGGTVADDATEYASLLASNNVAQNSWKPHWFISPFDPTVDATYDFYLAAFDGGNELARTEMQIIVGEGGAPIPEPGTALLLGAALVGLVAVRRKLQK